MKADAGIYVEPGLVERPEHGAELGLWQEGRRLARGAGQAAGIGRPVQVTAQPDGRLRPVVPCQPFLDVEADARLVDMVGPDRSDRRAEISVVEADVDDVVARLKAEQAFGREAGQRVLQGAAGIDAHQLALVGLLELIAVVGIVQEVGEVIVQVERRVDEIARHLVGNAAFRAGPVCGQGVALGIAAVGRVDISEAADAAVEDGALRDLVGRVPGVGVGHGGNRQPVAGRALVVAQHAVVLAQRVGDLPRAVVAFELEGAGQRAATRGHRSRRQAAPVAVAAAGRQHDVLLELVGIMKMHGRGRREVAFLRPIGPLARQQALGELGDQEIEIGIALPVRVRAQVDRHPVEPEGDIGAVVEVEAAQEILVGFSLTGMLRDDQARHRFEDFARPRDGEGVQGLAGDPLLRRSIRRLVLERLRRRHGDGRKYVGRAGLGCCRDGNKQEATEENAARMHLIIKVHTAVGKARRLSLSGPRTLLRVVLPVVDRHLLGDAVVAKNSCDFLVTPAIVDASRITDI